MAFRKSLGFNDVYFQMLRLSTDCLSFEYIKNTGQLVFLISITTFSSISNFCVVMLCFDNDDFIIWG